MKKYALSFKFSVISLLMALVGCMSVKADSWRNYEYNSSEGKEFYLTFMDNTAPDGAADLSMKLFMAARRPATVTIKMNNTGRTYTLTVNGSAVWSVPYKSDAYVDVPHQVTNKSITVTASDTITLYMSGFFNSVGDASVVFPKERLDKEYVVQSSDVNSNHTEFAVVATENYTQVTITPSVQMTNQTSTTALPANVSFTKTLQKGQVYFGSSFTSADDVSGTKICATKKVAVFSGSVAATVGNAMGTPSHVSHQMQPWKMCGTRFPMVRYINDTYNQNANVVRVTALYNNTVVKRNGSVVGTLQAFGTMKVAWPSVSQSMMVETSKQAVVCQYMAGKGEPGSPAMAFATDVQQGVNSIKFTTFPIEFNQSGLIVTDSAMQSYVNVVVPTSAVDSMLLDNTTIASQFASLNGDTSFMYAQVRITQSAHELTNAAGQFHATVYGYDTTSTPSYVFNAGLNCQAQSAYFLLNGVRQNEIEVCQSPDWKWHFTTTSIIPGDYTSVQWYDLYNGSYTYMSSDSIWNAALSGRGEQVHTVEMRVNRTTPVCGSTTTDKVTATIICHARYEDTLAIQEHCKTDVITVWEDTVRCDTLTVDSVYHYTRAFNTIYGCDSIVTKRVVVIDRKNMRVERTICQGDTTMLNDSSYTQAGVYIVPGFLGNCPFTDTLYLTVNPTYRFTERDTVCRSELPYSWRGKNLSGEAGVRMFYDSLQTMLGCDSLYEIELTIGEIYDITDTVVLCDVDTPYSWHGSHFSVSGVYYDSLSTHDFGCDSVHRLRLTVNPTYLFTDSMIVCSNDTFLWRDSVRSGFEPGIVILYDSLRTEAGCDSVYKRVLKVNPAYEFVSVDTICDYDSLLWREHHLSGLDSGYYEIKDSLMTGQGCDSVYLLRLTVNKSYHHVTERDICQGENYEFDQKTLTWMNEIPGRHDSTVYYTTESGCDSVLELHLTVYPVYTFDHYDTVCNNQTYHWTQGVIDTLINERSGGLHTYVKRFHTVAGCDSTHTLKLLVLDTVAVDTVMFIPDKGSVYWDGKWYCGAQSTGQCDTVLSVSATPYVFTHVYTAANGCDSVMRMTLKIDSTYDRTLNVKTCQGAEYSFNGRRWSWKKDLVGDHDTTYHYHSRLGYDSIWHLHLHVDMVYEFHQADSTCRNVPYTWRGHRRTYQNLEPGVHLMYDSLFTSKGCDSVYVLALTVIDTVAVTDNLTMDDNKSISWGGIIIGGNKYHGAADTILSSGVYYFERRFTSTECGCDSVMHLYLIVGETFEGSVNLTTCQHDDYLFNGQPWSWRKDDVGVHDTTYRYVGMGGMDSVWRVHLTVNPVYYFPETRIMCQNDTFVWKGHGRSFIGMVPGTYVYYDSLKTNAACDSVHMLTLTVNDTADSTHYITICDNETVTWDGETFVGDKSGDSTGTVYAARNNPYVIEHIYHKAATGCDSIERLILKVNKTYEFITDTTVCSKNGFLFNDKVYYVSGTYYDSMKTHDGCDSVYVLNLTLDNNKIRRQYIALCEGDSFLYRGRVINRHCTFVDSLVSKVGGCDSVIEVTVEILPTFHFRDTVDLCEGSVCQWHGKNLLYEGTYYDSLRSGGGCDSIYERFVRVHPNHLIVEYDTVCTVKPYHWRNKWYSESGTYHDTVRSHWGCDSVYELRLTVYEPNITEQYVEICEGQRFDFRGRDLSQTGVYCDTIRTQHGCDSILKLVLNVTRTYYFRDTMMICDGESYAWRGRQLALAGTYRDSLKTTSGCDSIYEMFLIVNPKYHFIKYDTVCSNGTYVWRNKTLTETGTYYDSLHTHFGCDSVYELRLTMNEIYIVERNESICQGQTLGFRNLRLSVAGTYYDTLRTSHGCDSIVKLILNVMPVYYHRDTTMICAGDSYAWRGRQLTLEGTYRDSLKTANGCDSIYEMFLIVNPKYHFVEYDTVCTNGVYNWRGMDITVSGTYYDRMKSHWGCDSIYELRLTMNEPYIVERNVRICQGQTFGFRNLLLSVDGTYYDTLHTSHGCDSIVKLILNMMPTYHYFDTTQFCAGSVYVWRGKQLSAAGTYYDSLRSAEGCDSIYELYLTENPSYHFVDHDTICSLQPYLWRGKYLSGSGTYYDSLHSSFGCDSVFELKLVLGAPTVTETYKEICEGDWFSFRGKRLSGKGVYYDTLKSRHGCDSVFKLVLNVTPTFYIGDTAEICVGDVYTWRGRSLRNAGTYRDSFLTVSGCDSIYELYLIVNPEFLDVKSDTVCTNGTYHWRNQWLTESGIYYDSLHSKAGCDSVYILNLTLNHTHTQVVYREICQGDSITFDNRTLMQDGVYDDTLKTTQGCDSIYRLVLNVRRRTVVSLTGHTCPGSPYNFRGRMVNNAGIHYDTVRNGNCIDTIYRLNLIVDSTYHYVASDTVCGGVYSWRGKTLTKSGVYYDSLNTQWGCDSVYELRLLVDSMRIRHDYRSICHGSSWLLNGRTITQPGVYCDTIVRGAKLCDSIVMYQLTVYPENIIWENTRHICLGDTAIFHGDICTQEGMQVHVDAGNYPQCDTIFKMFLDVDTPFHQIDSITICSNESATFRGRVVNAAGVYFDRLKDQWGCDSIYELRVRVKQASYSQFNVDICQNQFFTSPTGKKWNTQGVHNDTLLNSQGCDSILSYNLTVYALHHQPDTLSICRGGSGVALNGLTYSSPGIYTDTVNRTPANGCDTIFTTYVYYDTVKVSIKKTLCEGDVFALWGHRYTTAGTYSQFVLSTIPGDCDTLFNITIAVNQPADTLLTASTCDNKPYLFRGTWLTKSGAYFDTARRVNGCDSIIILRLTVRDSLIYPTEYQTICEDTVYEWIDGKKYNKDGTYHYNPQDSVTGCTEYHTLVLTTIKNTNLISVKDTAMCQDDEVYYIIPTYSGPAPKVYSISYSGGAVGTSGYMDTSFLVIPVPKTPDGKRVKPDNYTVTLQVGNEGCGLNTLSKSFKLVVRYPSEVLEQHFNDVVSVLNYKYNDKYDDTHANGYTFDAYKWYLNGRLLPGETKSNLYRTSMKQGDRVHAELRRSGETDFIPTCDIVIENFGIDTGYPVVIYRTSLPQTDRTTKLKASEPATYRVCTVSGITLQSGMAGKDEEVDLELPYVAGCYFLMVDAENAGRRIFKIIVH